MKRLTTPVILFLLVAVMMASLMPVAAGNIVNDPADCPAGTVAFPVIGESTSNSVSSIAYECVETPVIPPDTCPLDTTTPCVPPPPVDQCARSMEPCETTTPVVPHVVKSQPHQSSSQDGVSFNDSDLGVSLYVSKDQNGAPVLEAYETQNQTSNGNFALTITQDDLAQFANALPAENVLLKSAGHIKIYVLTTGEIAIFVGPDSEGKVHIKVFDGIPWSHVYGYTIDPQ